MDQLWKWIMHLNAKAFCALAALGLLAVLALCGFRLLNPPAPLQDGGDALPELSAPPSFVTLDFVTNQLAADALTIPVDPFRPTIEAISTNEAERAAFLKALNAARNAAAGITSTGNTKQEDPFAHLRRKENDGGGPTGPNGQPMIIPKITFLGFIQRPDGSQAALFHDSVRERDLFFDAGADIRSVTLAGADIREAEIRFPDGTSRKLVIGETIDLAAEPDPRPPKKPVPPAKAGAPQPKPGQPKAAQPAARANPKPDRPNRPVRP